MARGDLHDLLAFLAVARERSFTRAAAQLGISQSTLSHTIRQLEERLGYRLLTRTTRSVAPTDVGERLMSTVAPRLDEVKAELAALADLRDKPVGTIRITATEYGANTLIWPKLSKVMKDYPDIKIELVTDYALTDIVAQRFDIGVRFGDIVEKDMIAVRVGPNRRFVIVAAPSYLSGRKAPTDPRQLMEHDCITLRLPTSGTRLAWDLEKGDHKTQVKVSGQLTFGGVYMVLEAALAGYGLAFVPEDLAAPYVAAKRLKIVLKDWAPTFPGFHAYYPSRRQSSRALMIVIAALRHAS